VHLVEWSHAGGYPSVSGPSFLVFNEAAASVPESPLSRIDAERIVKSNYSIFPVFLKEENTYTISSYVRVRRLNHGHMFLSMFGILSD